MSDHQDQHTARQGRNLALVVAGTMLVWMAAQWVGPRLGLPARYVFLFDFAALAAFVWAIVVAFRIWRTTRHDNER